MAAMVEMEETAYLVRVATEEMEETVLLEKGAMEGMGAMVHLVAAKAAMGEQAPKEKEKMDKTANSDNLQGKK
jgi:hypothetical protein